jgi:hypothetical protein
MTESLPPGGGGKGAVDGLRIIYERLCSVLAMIWSWRPLERSAK